MTTPSGPLGYVEFPADDMERIKAFYADVFGWTFPGGDDYTFFDSGDGGIGGGMVVRGDGSPPHPLGYVFVEDVDAALERLVAAGGSVVKGSEQFGEAGWLAHATDTEGNLIGLWQAKGS